MWEGLLQLRGSSADGMKQAKGTRGTRTAPGQLSGHTTAPGRLAAPPGKSRAGGRLAAPPVQLSSTPPCCRCLQRSSPPSLAGGQPEGLGNLTQSPEPDGLLPPLE